MRIGNMPFTRMIVVAAMVAASGAACKSKSELFCESSADCMHGSGVCDIQGVCETSDYITNTCIATPCWDAATNPVADAMAADAMAADAIIPGDGSGPDACIPGMCTATSCGTTATGCGDTIDCVAGCSPQLFRTFEAGGQNGDEFGAAVDLDGDRLVIGASSFGTQNTGSAWVYEFNGTVWGSFQLDQTSPASNERFGSSVAIDGDLAVVGAPGGDRAFVFSQGTVSWPGVELTPSDSPPSSVFGASVGISGTRIVIGAPGANAAYVYDYNGSAWVETKVSPSNGSPSDQFGVAVAVDGDTIVVGAPNRATVGSAYVFKRSGNSWTETEIPPANPAGVNAYGIEVSVSGGTVAIGAPGTNSFVGAVHILAETSPGTWTATILSASNGQNDDAFGRAVDLKGELIAVGSMFAQAGMGRAYWFAPADLALAEREISTPAPTEAFGADIAIDRSGILVGAPGELGNGRVRLYRFPSP